MSSPPGRLTALISNQLTQILRPILSIKLTVINIKSPFNLTGLLLFIASCAFSIIRLRAQELHMAESTVVHNNTSLSTTGTASDDVIFSVNNVELIHTTSPNLPSPTITVMDAPTRPPKSTNPSQKPYPFIFLMSLMAMLPVG
ncbi:Uncharacterized protein Fot_29819 [Forsythia ovata]|uniref:Uncharacterized protein n=1 Tax=Forsythia ovata TaxID=205694 RepID=A0ABD1TSZ2_9LAMI